jgi:class 3 adenylate cyclase
MDEDRTLPPSQLGILFADVCGSTRLYETVGDAEARARIGRCIALMTEAAERRGGTLIKTIGDEIMCRFPRAEDAAAAALEMQDAVAGAEIAGAPGSSLAIHVGLHYGPVVIEERDIFGDAVNLASRMVNLAKRDQVLTTAATVDALPPGLRKSARQVDRAAVRGKKEPIDVYELVWQEAEATQITGRAWEVPPEVKLASARMLLTMGGHELEVSETHPSLTVGRSAQNDVVVPHQQASRLHARIDYRNGRFLLTDQSSNGTWIVDLEGKSTLVRHDSHVLSGSGMLAFGHLPAPGEPDLLRFMEQR